MKISVIMPAYNVEKVIGISIKSVLNQSIFNIELIIINDGSIDNTYYIAKEFSEIDQRVKVINRKENKGISFSRNEGIKLATGNYIAFIDSDDFWDTTKLEKQIEIMKKKQIKFSCTSYDVVDQNMDFLKKISSQEGYYNYIDLLRTNIIGCSTVVIESNLIKNNLMPNVKHEDYATWLNILSKNECVYFINDCLSTYVKSNNSTSGNKIKTINWAFKIFMQQKNFSILKRYHLFIRYLFYTIKKYCN